MNISSATGRSPPRAAPVADPTMASPPGSAMSSPRRTTRSSAARASSRARVMAARTLSSPAASAPAVGAGTSATGPPGHHAGAQLLGTGLGKGEDLVQGVGHLSGAVLVDGPGPVLVEEAGLEQMTTEAT